MIYGASLVSVIIRVSFTRRSTQGTVRGKSVSSFASSCIFRPCRVTRIDPSPSLSLVFLVEKEKTRTVVLITLTKVDKTDKQPWTRVIVGDPEIKRPGPPIIPGG